VEFIEGGSLDRLARGAPPSVAEAAALMEAVARAVGHAHARGVVHHDLKPTHVVLEMKRGEGWGTTTPYGTPKVRGFGLAFLPSRGREGEEEGMIVGTPSYMAPEQAAASLETSGRRATSGRWASCCTNS
jgi:serine/threonine-protein kinase